MKKYIIQKDNTIVNIIVAQDVSDIVLNVGETATDFSTYTEGDLSIGSTLIDGVFVAKSYFDLNIPNNSILTEHTSSLDFTFTKPLNLDLINTSTLINKGTDSIIQNVTVVNSKEIHFDIIPFPQELGTEVDLSISLDMSQLQDTHGNEAIGNSLYSLKYVVTTPYSEE